MQKITIMATMKVFEIISDKDDVVNLWCRSRITKFNRKSFSEFGDWTPPTCMSILWISC